LESRKCVLIIDDDKEICRSLSSVFRKKGFEVKVANSSKDALCILREARYDLAIIDRCLPDGKGTDLLEPLRQLNLTR
jgi:DNA-binding response OmpR family regulator